MDIPTNKDSNGSGLRSEFGIEHCAETDPLMIRFEPKSNPKVKTRTEVEPFTSRSGSGSVGGLYYHYSGWVGLRMWW